MSLSTQEQGRLVYSAVIFFLFKSLLVLIFVHQKATGYIYKIFVSPSSVCCLEKPLDVFVISFPKESTQVERTLLVSAVLFNHFILFEQDREY
mmetsp:Transcript_23483/g.53581  ORF Transcript_23483/g.53581 Transcript_23483/m.53581 type:complete len:93 (+) Transcript_23483:964-1242(+)